MDDALKLETNGSVTITVSSETRRLRRPKLGEFRKLREAIYDLDDMREQAGKDITPRALNETLEGRYLGWIQDAITMLSDRPLEVAEDDMPVWFLDGSVIRELLQHWRDVPLASGDQPR